MKIAKLLSNAWSRSFSLRAATCLSLVAMFVSGCGGGKIPQTHYYTLKFPPPAPMSEPKTTLVLDIEPFRSAINLRDDRITYYQSPTEFSYYTYHHWSPDPATMLTELTRRRLNEMAVFAHVRSLPTREPSDFILKGHLLNFDELDYEPGGKVRVALDLRLVRARDQKAVWSDRREVDHSIDTKGVDGVVNALSAASDQLLSEALPGLAAAAESEFNTTPQKTK
ncbi:MAG: ABC-type transport auxiliary lipoprotein family protein [Terriglobia bacterium]